MRNPYAKLEKTLGYRFRRRRHLEKALTHRSFRYENDGVDRDNQRLEFLGDAVLGLIAAEHLFTTFSDVQEGELTSLRSAIANSETLARIASRLDLGHYLQFGRGEEKSGGKSRSSNLADCLEAILGAAFLDGGLKAAERIFNRHFLVELEAVMGDAVLTNPKGALQELTQLRWKTSPRYKIVTEEGPAHDRTFTAEVSIDGQVFGTGVGASKQAAETIAASHALPIVETREEL